MCGAEAGPAHTGSSPQSHVTGTDRRPTPFTLCAEAREAEVSKAHLRPQKPWSGPGKLNLVLQVGGLHIK